MLWHNRATSYLVPVYVIPVPGAKVHLKMEVDRPKRKELVNHIRQPSPTVSDRSRSYSQTPCPDKSRAPPPSSPSPREPPAPDGRPGPASPERA